MLFTTEGAEITEKVLDSIATKITKTTMRISRKAAKTPRRVRRAEMAAGPLRGHGRYAPSLIPCPPSRALHARSAGHVMSRPTPLCAFSHLLL